MSGAAAAGSGGPAGPAPPGSGRTRAFRGTVAAPGFAIGPAHVCATWNDLVATAFLKMPAIVVAPYLDSRQIGTLDLQRIYGIVLERASTVDVVWEELRGVSRPSLIGCAGILEHVRSGDLVAIDPDEAVAVVAPEGRLLEYYRGRKGGRCKRDPHWVVESLRRLGDAIRPARYARGYRPPLDLPRDMQERLFAIARKVAGGNLPSPEEDAVVAALMDPPRVEPEELPDLPDLPGGGGGIP